jgi:hypothetical protein
MSKSKWIVVSAAVVGLAYLSWEIATTDAGAGRESTAKRFKAVLPPRRTARNETESELARRSPRNIEAPRAEAASTPETDVAVHTSAAVRNEPASAPRKPNDGRNAKAVPPRVVRSPSPTVSPATGAGTAPAVSRSSSGSQASGTLARSTVAPPPPNFSGVVPVRPAPQPISVYPQPPSTTTRDGSDRRVITTRGSAPVPAPAPLATTVTTGIGAPSEGPGLLVEVVNNSTRRPLARIAIGYEFFDAIRRVSGGAKITDPTGTVRIPFPQLTGRLTLRLSCEGFVEEIVEVDDPTALLSVRFVPYSHRKFAMLLDTNGLPIPFAFVRLERPNPAEHFERTSNLEGAFPIDGWPAGLLTVNVTYLTPLGSRTVTRKVEVQGQPGRYEEIVIELDVGKSLRLNLRNRNGAAVSLARLWVRLLDTATSASWRLLPLATSGSGLNESPVSPEGLLYIAGLPSKGTIEVRGFGVDPADAAATENQGVGRAPERSLDRLFTLYARTQVRLDERAPSQEAEVAFSPMRRVQLSVVDERGAFQLEVLGVHDVARVGPNEPSGVRQFLLLRNSAFTLGTHELRFAADIDADVTLLSASGGAVLQPQTLKRFGDHNVVEVQRPGFIVGTVTRASDGEPISGATVSVEFRSGLRREFVTGAAGWFSIRVGNEHPEKLVARYGEATVERRSPNSIGAYELEIGPSAQ